MCSAPCATVPIGQGLPLPPYGPDAKRALATAVLTKEGRSRSWVPMLIGVVANAPCLHGVSLHLGDGKGFVIQKLLRL